MRLDVHVHHHFDEYTLQSLRSLATIPSGAIMALKESIATLIATDTTLNTEVEQLIADSAGGPGRIAEAVRAALAARDADEADITAAVDAANTAAQTEVDNIHNVLNPAPASEPTA